MKEKVREFWIDFTGRVLDNGNCREAEVHFKQPPQSSNPDPENGKTYNIHVIEKAPVMKQMQRLVEALEIANDRDLDWDMMDRKDSLRKLQDWRGKCFDALDEHKKWMGKL